MKIQELGKLLMTLKDKADSTIIVETGDGTLLDLQNVSIDIKIENGEVIHVIKLKVS